MWYDLEHTKGCENLPSFPEQGVGFSEAKCSDGAPSAPSKSSDTRATSSYNGSETESLTNSQSGTMFAPSTEIRGWERSMSSAEVSHAKTSAAPGEDSELSVESGADCGESTPGSFARYDRATASWKTAQCLLLGGLESFSVTWPRSGMMRRGRCYPLAIAAHRMNGSGCGSSQKIPTPTVHGNYNRKGLSKNSGDGLATFVKKFPTPCRSDYKGAGKTGTFRDRLDYAAERGRTKSNVYPTPRTNGQIGAGNGGKLNPDWVEWLMGWPIGWTASKPLETDKFQSWLQGRFVN